MTDHAERLAWIRTVIAAHGGWNRRSRAALHAWARDQLLDEHVLVQLVEEAFRLPAPQVRAVAPSSKPRTSQPTPPAPRRWWLTLISVVGLASSLALFWLLLEQWPSTPDDSPRRDKPAAPAPVVTNPTRTLPPPPVSFPTPPTLGGAATLATAEAVVPIEARPPGALTAEALERWRVTCAQAMVAWPTMTSAQRDRMVASVAAWIAQSATTEDVDRLQAAASADVAHITRAREAMLASAFDAMLQASVRADERLTPAAAARLGDVRPLADDASDTLQSWALQQVSALEKSLAQPDARERWVGWLQAVAAIDRADARLQCALAAIDALVRGTSRLDGQGLAADVLGSLLAAVPGDPRQSGFDATRRAFVRWLADPAIASARLWALGGIWRSGGHAPDPWLLPGERDSAQARAALEKRWNAIDTARAAEPWHPLQDRMRALASTAPATKAACVLMLAEWMQLIRQGAALLQQRDPERVQPAAVADRPMIARVSAQDASWVTRLADARPERRMEALQTMRARALEGIGERDAEALAARAFSAPGRDERSLAQSIIRDNLLQSSVMLRAMAMEVARTDDPRNAVELVEVATGRMLLGDAQQQVRAQAIAALLACIPPPSSSSELELGCARLRAETSAWGSEYGLSREADVDAWSVAQRMRGALQGLSLPDAVQPLMQDIDARMRRLRRVAGLGPRGFAAAAAVLCDLQAATLAAQHLQQAPALRLLADEAAMRRLQANSALAQAAISLQAIVRMQLACAGGPIDALPSAVAAAPPDRAGAMRHLAEADALLAGPDVDVPRVQVLLEAALQDDPSMRGSVDLARARLATAHASAQCLESARADGAGAMLPASDALPEGLALASVLAQRGQSDRLAAQRGNEPAARALAAFAAAQGLLVDEVLRRLRSADAAEREAARDSMEAAVMQRLDPEGAPWWSAIVAGMDARVPEPAISGGRLVR